MIPDQVQTGVLGTCGPLQRQEGNLLPMLVASNQAQRALPCRSVTNTVVEVKVSWRSGEGERNETHYDFILHEQKSDC